MDEVAAIPGRSSRRRRVRWAVAGAVAVGVVLLGRWWLDPLRGLPDVGDPFDRAEIAGSRVRGEENAFGPYTTAARLLSAIPKTYPSDEEGSLDWDRFDGATRGWLASNQQALEYWLAGADRPDALYIQADQVAIDTTLPVTDGLRSLARLGAVEAARRVHEGDLAGAWEIERAILRSGVHCGRHGILVERLVDAAIVRQATERIVRWAADPRVDAALLRRALADVEAAEAMRTPASEVLKREYVLLMNALEDPRLRDAPAQYARLLQWSPPPPSLKIGPLTLTADQFRYGGLARSSRGEPERSRRVLRLVFANWLAACDRPVEDRPPVVETRPALFRHGPDAPAAARALPPERIAEEFADSMFAPLLLPEFLDYLRPAGRPPGSRDPIAGESEDFRTLVDALTEQLRLREAGGL